MQGADSGASHDHLGSGRRRNDDLIVHPQLGGSDTGPSGVIREVTPDKRTVFYVKYDIPSANDNFNKVVGNNFLTDDLYSMNGGGPK